VAKIGEQMNVESAMRLAIEEAKRGAGFVSPNPLVGCAVLDSEGRLLSLGHHARVGFDHAEVDALKKLEDHEDLDGATMVVTLEPCAHDGRTPSCARALSKLPLARVIYGLNDPNPLVSGKGAEILRSSGIPAYSFAEFADGNAELPHDQIATLIEDLEDLPEVFLKNMRKKQVFFAFKVGASLDGQIGLQNGESKWITSETSREEVQRIRARYDAILVGRRTFELDHPKLNVRLPGFEDHRNKAIVIDPYARALERIAKSDLLKVRAPSDVLWVIRRGHEHTNPAGVKIIETDFDASSGQIDLRGLAREFWSLGIKSVLIEGGAHTISDFLKADLIDRAYVFLAPMLIGSKGALSWTQGLGIEKLSQAAKFSHIRISQHGADLLWTGCRKEIP